MGILGGKQKEVIIQTQNLPLRSRDQMMDEEERITKEDLKRLARTMAQEKEKKSNREQMLEAGRKGFNSVRSGLHDVAKSLNTPDSRRRPRIARIPNLRRAGISQTMDLGKLKDPGLQNRNIVGHRIKHNI